MTDGLRWCRYCKDNKPVRGFRLQVNHRTQVETRGHKCLDCQKLAKGYGTGNKSARADHESRAHVCPRCKVFRNGWEYQNVYRMGAEHVCMSCVDTERRKEAIEAIPEHERLAEPYRAVFANGVALMPSLVTVVGQRGHLLHAMFDKTLKTGKMTKAYTALVNPDTIFSAADGVDVERVEAVLAARLVGWKMTGKS